MNLITDRTLADVERVSALSGKVWDDFTEEEKSEWLAGMKGAYNYTDLNRVESAMQTLGNMMGLRLVVRTNWSASDIPTESDTNRFLGNIRALKDAMTVKVVTYDVPATMNNMTYETANQIEQILVDLMNYIDAWYKCGEIYCGEV